MFEILRRTMLVVGCLALTTSCSQAGLQGAQDLEVAFQNLSFRRPVDLQHAGDGTNRLFVVEQAGIIHVFPNNPQVAATEVFLDIEDRVSDRSNEMGLLGLAFHPNYASNGLFYVNYTAESPRRTIIARYRVDSSNANQADRNSEEVLLEVEQPYGNHNGGQIAFGPDGYLYIAYGDGGAGGDPDENGQNLSTLLGTIARIDVDTPDEGKKYGIPADNPFVGALCGALGCRDEIYAYGLRNPWRFSFDPETGQLWTGDVGQNAWEEIDIIEKGGNYGWNTMEGMHCYDPSSGCNTDGLKMPIWEYGRGAGISITGGYVYRGANVPAMVGTYIYGDFGTGRIWALSVNGTDVQNEELLDTSLGISSFGVDEQQELYVCAFDGKIYRFVPTVGAAVEEEIVPAALDLERNYPNPFMASTVIPFRLERPSTVKLIVYDVLGRSVRTLVEQALTAGLHQAAWDGRNEAGRVLPVGPYFYRLTTADGLTLTRSMIRAR